MQTAAPIENFPSRPSGVWIAALLVVALLVRWAAVEWTLRRGAGQFPDSVMYQVYAEAMYQSRSFHIEDAMRTPGYPAFLAICWGIAGDASPRAPLLVQAVLSALSCWLVYHISVRILNGPAARGIGLVALAINVFDPYSIVQSTFVLTETVYTFLQLACVALGLRAFRLGSLTVAGLCGVLAGIAVLARPSGLLLAIGAWILWIWWLRKQPGGARIALVTACCFLLVLAPWWIRNYRRYGALVLTTLNVGESLYDGLRPGATGASEMSFIQAESAVLGTMTEQQRDRYWRQKAVESARAQPGRVLELAVIKLARFWSPWPNEARFRTPAVVLATTLWALPLYLFTLVGAWHFRRRWPVLCISLLPAVYFCGLHMVFVSSVRYRIPVTPLLSILAAAGLVAIWKKSRAV